MKTDTLLLIGLGIGALALFARSDAPQASRVTPHAHLTPGRRYSWAIETDSPPNWTGAEQGLYYQRSDLERESTAGSVAVFLANVHTAKSVPLNTWTTFPDGHRERTLSIEDVGPATA